MIIGSDSDAAVLAFLRAHGPGTVSVKYLAGQTGLPRVVARTSVIALAAEGLLCLISDPGESTYMIRHVHAVPGPCEHSLGCVISEDPG